MPKISDKKSCWNDGQRRKNDLDGKILEISRRFGFESHPKHYHNAATTADNNPNTTNNSSTLFMPRVESDLCGILLWPKMRA